MGARLGRLRRLARPVRRAFRPMIVLRARPYSRRSGTDRGTALDRVYIERFLEHHADAIHGEVLEANDDNYTKMFGTSCRAHVVDIRTTNERATIIADLCVPGSLPHERFDCVLLTHTLQLLADLAVALTTRPGQHRLLALGPRWTRRVVPTDHARLRRAGELVRECRRGCRVL